MADWYVDPSRDGNVGDGTSGDMYGDLQYALDQVGTSPGQGLQGDEFHIKSGTSEILAGQLSLTTYGTPDHEKRLTFRGFETTIRDGLAKGVIDGDGTYSVINSGSSSDISFIDMHLTNAGASRILRAAFYCFLYRCEISNSTVNDAVLLDAGSEVSTCYFHDIAARGLVLSSAGTAYNNYFQNGTTNKFIDGLQLAVNCSSLGNIFSLDGASNAILMGGDFIKVANNSILSVLGSGTGIRLTSLNNSRAAMIANNIVEGFTVGINWGGSVVRAYLAAGNNACRNNTTDYTGTLLAHYYDDNEINTDFASSPFEKTGLDTFANRFAYFEPKDVGNIRAGSMDGYTDKGAFQHADTGGGGGGTEYIPVRQSIGLLQR